MSPFLVLRRFRLDIGKKSLGAEHEGWESESLEGLITGLDRAVT